jgi:hypothetical protein
MSKFENSEAVLASSAAGESPSRQPRCILALGWPVPNGGLRSKAEAARAFTQWGIETREAAPPPMSRRRLVALEEAGNV